MKLKRYVGDIVTDIDPKWKNIELLWVTVEYVGKETKPSFWFKHNGWIYLGICDYAFEIFESYDDWEYDMDTPFNQYSPGEKEFNELMIMKPIYFKANPEEIFKEGQDLGKYCRFELDFIRDWYSKL